MKSLKKSLKKKIITSVLSTALVGVMAFTSIPVSAQKAITKEFGTMTYSLKGSGNTVEARTRVENKANKILTKLTIQVNATGKTIFNYTQIKEKAYACDNVKVTNYSVKKLAAWGCHEARGNSAVAKYTSAVF